MIMHFLVFYSGTYPDSDPLEAWAAADEEVKNLLPLQLKQVEDKNSELKKELKA